MHRLSRHHPTRRDGPLGPRGVGQSLLLIAALTLLAACAAKTQPLPLPPVSATPTGVHHVGKFVWFDLITDDVPAVKRFYGELLGWTFQGDEKSYTTILNRGRPIGGIVYHARVTSDVGEARWLGSLSVADIDTALEVVRQAGGKVYEGPEHLPGRGRFAIVSDSQGAMFAVLRAQGGDPADGEPMLGDWLWTELWTKSLRSTLTFYINLVGYEPGVVKLDDGYPYVVLRRDGVLRAGVIPIPWDGITPNWVPAVLVEDPKRTLAQVEALGGQVALDPEETLIEGSAAVLIDPSGAALMIDTGP